MEKRRKERERRRKKAGHTINFYKFHYFEREETTRRAPARMPQPSGIVFKITGWGRGWGRRYATAGDISNVEKL